MHAGSSTHLGKVKVKRSCGGANLWGRMEGETGQCSACGLSSKIVVRRTEKRKAKAHRNSTPDWTRVGYRGGYTYGYLWILHYWPLRICYEGKIAFRGKGLLAQASSVSFMI